MSDVLIIYLSLVSQNVCSDPTCGGRSHRRYSKQLRGRSALASVPPLVPALPCSARTNASRAPSRLFPTQNIGLYGAFKPQIHRIWGGVILTTGGRAPRPEEGYSKFQLMHAMGNGNPREVYETDSPNVR